jgi:hypothetical protein
MVKYNQFRKFKLYNYVRLFGEKWSMRVKSGGLPVSPSLVIFLKAFAGIFAPTVTPLLWASTGLWLPFVIFGSAHIAAALSVGILGIETKEKVLEQI